MPRARQARAGARGTRGRGFPARSARAEPSRTCLPFRCRLTTFNKSHDLYKNLGYNTGRARVNHFPPVTCGDARTRAAQTTISSCPYRPTRREVAEWRTATLAALFHEQCEAAHLLSRVPIGGQPGCGAHRDAQRRDMSRGSPAAHPSERESDAAQGAHRPAAPLYAATAPRRRAPRPCEQQQRGRHRSLSRHGRRSPPRRRLQSNRLERMRSRSFMAHSSRPAVPPALVARRFSDRAMRRISVVRQIHLVGARHARSAGPGKRHGLMARYGRGNGLPSGRIGQHSPGQPVAAGSSSGARCTQQANRTTARRAL